MKHSILLSGIIICGVVFLSCGCSQKTKSYDITDNTSDSIIQVSLPDDSKKGLIFKYTGKSLDVGEMKDDGTSVFYSEEEIKKQIDERGRENTLDIVEENGLKINYSAHPDDLSSLPDTYDEYVYSVGPEDNILNVASVHILMNEDAFKNRLQQIKDEYVPDGMDIYSDGVNVQGFASEESPHGNIELKWIPEAKKGYMIEIYSPDYDFADISCSIDLKEEETGDVEDFQEMQESKKEMSEYIADFTVESSKVERKEYQDNIASYGLLMYDDEGYLISGVSLYDENGDIISIAEDTEHKWCYDERGWVVRADTVEVPYTPEFDGGYGARYGDLVPIK